MADPATQFQSAGLQVPYNYIPEVTRLNPPMHLNPVDYSSIGLALKDLPQALMNSPLNPAVRESIRLQAAGAKQGQAVLAEQAKVNPLTGQAPRQFLGRVEGGTYSTAPGSAYPMSIPVVPVTPENPPPAPPTTTEPTTEPEKSILEEPTRPAETPSKEIPRQKFGGEPKNSMGQRLVNPQDMYASTSNPRAPAAPGTDYVTALNAYKVPSQGGSTAGLTASTDNDQAMRQMQQQQQEQAALQQWQNQNQGSAASARSALDWAQTNRDTSIDRAVYMDHGGPDGSPAFAFYSGKKSAPNIVGLKQMVKSGFAPDVLAQNTSTALSTSQQMTGQGSSASAMPPAGGQGPAVSQPMPSGTGAGAPQGLPGAQPAPAPAMPTVANDQTGPPVATTAPAAPAVDENGQPITVGPPAVPPGSTADRAAKAMVAQVQQMTRVPSQGGVPLDYLSAQATVGQPGGPPGLPPVDSNGVPRHGLNDGTVNHDNTDGLSQWTNGQYSWDDAQRVIQQARQHNFDPSLYPPNQSGDLKIGEFGGMGFYAAMGPNHQRLGYYVAKPGQDLFTQDRMWWGSNHWEPYELPEQVQRKNLHTVDPSIPMPDLMKMPPAEVTRRLRDYTYMQAHQPLPPDVQVNIDQARGIIMRGQKLLNTITHIGDTSRFSTSALEKSERGKNVDVHKMPLNQIGSWQDALEWARWKVDQWNAGNAKEDTDATQLLTDWNDLANFLGLEKETNLQSHAALDKKIGNLFTGSHSGTLTNQLQTFIKNYQYDMHRSINGAINQRQAVKPKDYSDDQGLIDGKQIYNPSDHYQRSEDTTTPHAGDSSGLSPQALQDTVRGSQRMRQPAIVQVNTRRDYDALPRGTRYMDSQGTIGTKMA